MTRRSPYNEDYDYDDSENDDKYHGVKHFKREKDEQKKKWDRESQYDRDHDYDERR